MSSIEELCEQAVSDGTIPGAVLLAQDKTGKFSYGKAFGKVSLEEGAGDMQLDTVMMLASMTKLLTSISVLQIVEKGLVDLDDDVSSSIPTLAKQQILSGFDDAGQPILKARTNPITLRLLLTHSAGAAYDAWTPDLLKWHASQGTKPRPAPTVVERFGFPLVYEPGTAWMYSSAIDWAGQVLEKITGETLESWMQKNICNPLGIKGISFWPEQNAEMKTKIAGMSARDPQSGRLVAFNQPFLNTGSTDCFGGHGGYADLTEYIKVLHSILVDDGKLLKPETTARMFQPQLTKGSKASLKQQMGIPEIVGMFVGDFPSNVEYDWGLGGLLVQGSGEGRRKNGTLIWSGMPNLFWFIDREAGLCGVFGTQVLPPGDLKVEALIKAFELAMNERYSLAAKL